MSNIKNNLKYCLLFFPLMACQAQVENKINLNSSGTSTNLDSIQIVQFYQKYSSEQKESVSTGSVSEGSLENGKIVPYFGSNFTYFDKDSYLASRAFTSDVVKKIILNTYNVLDQNCPDRHFYLMELSNHEGGKIYPHLTHQNGLSVDFMMPKLKNGAPNYDLDTLGKQHYFLEFNDQGEYIQDTSIKIDFDLVAKHILHLNEEAIKLNYSIEKVIIKIEYKDDLFSTPHGKILEKSGIYIAKKLSPLTNSIHDDHFHVDFKEKGIE